MRTFAVLSAVLFLSLSLPAFAAPPTVNVPVECTVVDTDSVEHTYSGQYLGICALEAARAQGAVSAYTLQNFSFGLFLESLNGIMPGATEFWALSHNNVEASVGLTDLVVAQGDTITLQLTDWSTNTAVGSPVEFSIGALLAASNESSGGGGEFLQNRLFSVEHAFDFLVAHQKPDGSFGSQMLTDWAAIAFGTTEISEACNDGCPAAREKLRAYLADTTVSTSSATELERHIMALQALGINPYDAPGKPVESLVALFDGTQMGDPSLVNDDIFALFPLTHAGYASNDPMIQKILSFILSKQKANGSWEDSVDLTAAAIQALAPFSENAALERAKEFLRRSQNDSGIFGTNSFTLSWALQAIGALGETNEEWEKSGVTPAGYLGIFQQTDGGMEPTVVNVNTRIWATAYAIPAAFRKPWNDILKSFPKPPPAPVVEAKVVEPIVQQTVSAPTPAAEIFVATSTDQEPIEEILIDEATTSVESQTAAAGAIEYDFPVNPFVLLVLALFGASGIGILFVYFLERARVM